MSPTVSVIIPTYNRAHLIDESLKSVFEQTFVDWEIIVVDDGSTDDTMDRIKEYDDDRIRYYRIEHCGVIGTVRNVGIKNAHGKFIAFLDSDDLWQPSKLDYQLSLLNENPQASFVFGHGQQFGNSATATPELEKFFLGNVFKPFLLEGRFIFYVPTLLFKREVLDKISFIDESLFYSGDIDFFLRIAYAFEGIFSQNIVVRIRKQEMSHSLNDELSAYKEYLVMLKKHFHENRLKPKQFIQLARRHHYKLGLLLLSDGKSKRARQEFWNYIRLNPLSFKGWIRFAQSLTTADAD